MELPVLAACRLSLVGYSWYLDCVSSRGPKGCLDLRKIGVWTFGSEGGLDSRYEGGGLETELQSLREEG